jgi:transposase
LDEQPVRIESIPKTNFQCSEALDEGGHNERLVALGRKNSLFAGSDGGARHWAIVSSLVATAKLNGVEPQAWLTDVLERMVSGRTKAHELERLLPWTWKTKQFAAAVDA